MLWKWASRRHSGKKDMMWIKHRYFIRHKGQDWTFFARNKTGEIETIFQAAKISIIRHPKIKGNVNPYDKADESYFEKRIDNNMLNKLDGKHMMRYLYERQNGLCLICQKRIRTITGWNTHHLIPKHLGGKWIAKNLVMLHPVCHVQGKHSLTPSLHPRAAVPTFAKKNMTKKAKHMYELVGAWRKSQESKTDYCQSVPINIHTFTYWVQKYKQKGADLEEKKKAPKFIPLTVKKTTLGSKSELELNYPNGVRLCVNGQLDVELLRALIKINV